MCGAIYLKCRTKNHFPDYIASVAEKIKKACNVEDWNLACDKSLKTRDKIHDNISLLCEVMSNVDECVRIGILQETKHMIVNL